MKTLSLCGLFAAFVLLAGGGGIALLTAQDKKDKDYVSPTLPGGVPVFQPGKDKAKDDKTEKKEFPPVKVIEDKSSPPTVVADEGGKMPLKFLKNKLSDMTDGDKGYIPVSAIMVDSDRTCYVDPANTVFSTSPLRKDIVVQVTKDDKGFHLGLPEKLIQHKWSAVDDDKMKTMTSIKSVKVLAE